MKKKTAKDGASSAELLTYGDAAKLTKLSERTLRAAVRSGELEHVAFGRAIRFTHEQLTAWIRAHRKGGTK